MALDDWERDFDLGSVNDISHTFHKASAPTPARATTTTSTTTTSPTKAAPTTSTAAPLPMPRKTLRKAASANNLHASSTRIPRPHPLNVDKYDRTNKPLPPISPLLPSSSTQRLRPVAENAHSSSGIGLGIQQPHATMSSFHPSNPHANAPATKSRIKSRKPLTIRPTTSNEPNPALPVSSPTSAVPRTPDDATFFRTPYRMASAVHRDPSHSIRDLSRNLVPVRVSEISFFNSRRCDRKPPHMTTVLVGFPGLLSFF